jgi:hypothetical protein
MTYSGERTTFYDEKGQPKLHPQWGYHQALVETEGNGRATMDSVFGLDGKLILHAQSGVARTRIAYEEEGSLRILTCFDQEDKPTLQRLRGAHQFKERLDERGRIIEIGCFDLDGKATTCKQGFHREVITYGTNGEATQKRFALDGTPVE